MSENIEVCKQCGNEYERIGQHWGHPQSLCSFPEPTQRQWEIIMGRHIGDGYWNTCNKNPFMEIQSICWPYLEWLSDTLVNLATEPVRIATGEEISERMDGRMGECNRQDFYGMYLRSSPKWNEFIAMDRYPEDLTLTPTIFRHWFVSDWNTDRQEKKRPHMRFNIADDPTIHATFQSWFDPLGVELVDGGTYENTVTYSTCRGFRFSADDSQRLWEWMGDPVPGYEYKWVDGPTYNEWKEEWLPPGGKYGTPRCLDNATVESDDEEESDKTEQLKINEY